jgi:hypothetical protein
MLLLLCVQNPGHLFASGVLTLQVFVGKESFRNSQIKKIKIKIIIPSYERGEPTASYR